MPHEERQAGAPFAVDLPALFCPREVRDDMDRVNQYPLYELGKALQAVALPTGDVAANAVIFNLHSALISINALLGGTPFPLGISRTAANEIRTVMQQIWNKHFVVINEKGAPEFHFPAQDTMIPSWEWGNIRTALERFETIFSAELGELTSYFVPRLGIYSTPALAETADESFPAELQPFIPEKTKLDWRAAGVAWRSIFCPLRGSMLPVPLREQWRAIISYLAVSLKKHCVHGTTITKH